MKCGYQGCREEAVVWTRLEIIRAKWAAVIHVPRCEKHR